MMWYCESWPPHGLQTQSIGGARNLPDYDYADVYHRKHLAQVVRSATDMLRVARYIRAVQVAEQSVHLGGRGARSVSLVLQ